jgi:hypothetical protein
MEKVLLKTGGITNTDDNDDNDIFLLMYNNMDVVSALQLEGQN